MNKDKLQAEILEKIKEGVKPSDLKKKQTPTKTKKEPEPIKIPNLSAYVNGKDDGYESDQSNKSVPKVPPLPNQNLLDQITSLQKQLQLYQDFKEADLKIKEGYKQELTEKNKTLTELQKTIAELKNQAKTTTNIKQQQSEPQETKPPKLYLFTCDICEQTKKSQLHLGKVNGLGINPLKENKICDHCIRKVDLILPPREEFF